MSLSFDRVRSSDDRSRALALPWVATASAALLVRAPVWPSLSRFWAPWLRILLQAAGPITAIATTAAKTMMIAKMACLVNVMIYSTANSIMTKRARPVAKTPWPSPVPPPKTTPTWSAFPNAP